MKICRVVGSVVTAQVADRLDGPTYLLVAPATTGGEAKGAPIVAVDAVQAGQGDVVIVAQGSSSRQIQAPDSPETHERAVDAVVIGVIDLIDSEGAVTYRSSDAEGGAG